MKKETIEGVGELATETLKYAAGDKIGCKFEQLRIELLERYGPVPSELTGDVILDAKIANVRRRKMEAEIEWLTNQILKEDSNDDMEENSTTDMPSYGFEFAIDEKVQGEVGEQKPKKDRRKEEALKKLQMKKQLPNRRLRQSQLMQMSEDNNDRD